MIKSPHTQANAASASARHGARALAACCVLGGLMVAGAVIAEPGDGPGGRQDRRDRQQVSQAQDRADSRYDQRPGDPRAYDTRAEDQRRAAAQEQSRSESARRNGRMTADERRDLRRQINEAQDLYGKPPQR